MAIQGPLRIRFARFTVASAIATAISQFVLLGVYGPLNATTASTVAFLAGSVPHFLLVRYWAWRDTDPGRLPAQVATYAVVTLTGGVASIGLTTLAEEFVLPLVTNGAWRAVVLTLAYLAASGPVFLLKFAILDRVFASLRSVQRRERRFRGVERPESVVRGMSAAGEGRLPLGNERVNGLAVVGGRAE